MLITISTLNKGFTPAAVAPPNAITPEQVIPIIALREGAGRRNRHCPLRILPVLCAHLNAITPERVIHRYHAQRRGGMGGTGTVPSVIVQVL